MQPFRTRLFTPRVPSTIPVRKREPRTIQYPPPPVLATIARGTAVTRLDQKFSLDCSDSYLCPPPPHPARRTRLIRKR